MEKSQIISNLNSLSNIFKVQKIDILLEDFNNAIKKNYIVSGSINRI